jgi:hypothetical protein
MCRVLNARKVGKRSTESQIYIGRPGKWGNPFVIGRDGSRAEVIAKYRAWVLNQPQLMGALGELRGRDLVCWCAPLACQIPWQHGSPVMLEQVDDALWIAEGANVSFYGAPYPTRSVIVRLGSGGLWIWSPVELTSDLRADVDRLGPVRHLVSPNKLRHLYLRE